MNKRRILRNAGKYDSPVARPDATQVAKKYLPIKELPPMTLPVKRTLAKRLSGRSLTSTPPYYLARDVIGKFIGATGTTYTEQDFTDPQLKIIDEQVRHRLNKHGGVTGNYFLSHPNDTIVMGLGANTLYPELYGRSYGRPIMVEKLTTPLGQVETILGDYGIKVYKDGYEVFDIYDFNTGQGQYKGNNSLYAKARRWAGKYGHKDTDDDKGKLKIIIKRNVTHW